MRGNLSKNMFRDVKACRRHKVVSISCQALKCCGGCSLQVCLKGCHNCGVASSEPLGRFVPKLCRNTLFFSFSVHTQTRVVCRYSLNLTLCIGLQHNTRWHSLAHSIHRSPSSALTKIQCVYLVLGYT